MMKKYTHIKKVTEEVYSDQKPHNISEVREKCAEYGIDLSGDKNAISNMVFKLKKDGFLRSTGVKGEYQMITRDTIADIKDQLKENAAIQPNWEEFFILKPQRQLKHEMKVVVVEKGEIRINSVLMKHIDSNEIELIFSKKCDLILLNPGKKTGHKFTKAGTTKNKEIVEHLRKQKVPLPAVYTVNWDEKYNMWKGELQIECKK